MPFLESLRNRAKGIFNVELPPMELPPEKENELIEKLVTTVGKYKMESAVILLASGFIPISTIVSQTTLLTIAPLLELLGIHGYEYTAFFNNKNNLKRLLQRLLDNQQERDAKQEGFW
jgi:hypothetical protein